MNYLSKENVQEVLGLAPLQESIWQAQISAGETDVIGQVRFTCAGEIDVSQFQQAWNHVVQAYPILRSVFRQVRNRNVQVVLKTRPLPVVFHDLRAQPALEQQSCLLAVSLEQRAHFELANGPLARLALFQVAQQECLLLLTYHQIILDDESCQMVLADLLTTYNAGLRGHPLPPCKRSLYQHYLTWLAQQDWTPARTFWAEQLKGLDGPTKLKIARNGEAARSDGYSSHTVSLPAALSQELSAFARRHNVTRSALLQAAWAVLWSRYNNEEEVVYSLQCSGRPRHLQEAGAIIGRLAQSLPERILVDGNLQLPAFVQGVQEQYENLLEYAYLPLNDEYGGRKERRESVNSLAVYEFDEVQNEEHGLRLVAEETLLDRPGELSVTVKLRACWQIDLSCPVDIALPNELEKLVLHFQTLLENMVRPGEMRVADLEILPDDERSLLLQTGNQAETAYPLDHLAHQVIEEQALLHPRKIAATYKDEHITYEELNKKANQLAHWLRSQGFGRNDLAALLAERGLDMLIAILAVFKAGGVYVPLDAAHPDSRLRTLLQACGTKVLLTQHYLLQRSLMLTNDVSIPCTVFCLDATTTDDLAAHAGLLQHYSEENSACLNQPGDLAYVIYTSGSTGAPKGVMIEHIGMLNHLGAKIQLLQLSPASTVVQSASHCFDISVWQFLAPLMVGGTVAIYENEMVADPETLLAALQRDRATVVEVVPTLLDMLLQIADELSPEARALPNLDYLISTGEGLPIPLCRRWFVTYPHVKVVNAYGPTECSDDVTHEVFLLSPAEEQNTLSIGRPIQHFNIYVLDNRQRLLPTGCVGEICVAGIGVGRGYLHDPERTQAVFLTNPFCDDPTSIYARLYRTGDLGYRLPDGRIIHLGRLDSQIKVRGHRIELGEIEATLLRHPAVKQCVATAQPDSQQQTHILAYVVLDDSVETAPLREFLRGQLPEYMVPEHILALDALPMNSNQKVDRKALPFPHAFEANAVEAQFAPPRNAIETCLAEIWGEVLGVSPIGIDDGFFQLGGHSLKLIQVRSRIKQHFAVTIDLHLLFENQTIRQLAPLIEQYAGKDNSSGIVPISRSSGRESFADYPMSHTQRRLWFQQQLLSQHEVYAMPVALQLEGPLDASAFQQAWQTLVERHASLRTTFTMKDGEPIQRITSKVKVSCLCIDLSSLQDEGQQQVIARIIMSESQSGFDLETGPLFRVRWAILAPERHLLLLNMHHIISDAWSWQILQQEFAELYEAFSHHQPLPLQELPIQYVDYTHWQNKQVAEGAFEEHERYWITRFADAPSPLDLPTDYERPARQSYKGQKWQFALNASMLARLKQICQQHEATLFMVLLSAISTLFFRLSEQEDIVIGTPVSGRNRLELEDLIGCFINMLPLRVNLTGKPTFLELLERVKSTALEAYAYQEYPFDMLVDKLNLAHDPGRSPLFSVAFQVQQNTSDPQGSDLTVKPYAISVDRALYDVSITFAENEDRLDGWLEYSTDLFERESIIRMGAYLQNLLEAIVADPEQPITSLSFLPEAEYQLLLKYGTTTPHPDPSEMPVHQLFEAQVQRTPQALALVCGENCLSYRELDERVNQLARYLQRLGVGPDKMVGVFLERSLEMVIALLAVLKAGGAYVSLDPNYPRERLLYMLEDAQVSLIVTQTWLHKDLPGYHGAMLDLHAERHLIIRESPVSPPSHVSGQNIACVFYTSGSTGRPKGVLSTHAGIANYLTFITRMYQVTKRDIILQLASTSFDASIRDLLGPLTVGGKVILMEDVNARDAEVILSVIGQQRVTGILSIVPSFLKALLIEASAGNYQTETLRLLLVSGEALYWDTALEARSALGGHLQIVNQYGPTECTMTSTYFSLPFQDAEGEMVSLGYPIGKCQVFILDQHLQLAPIGSPGELYIGGAGLTRGYLNHPEITAERFIPHLFSNQPGARLYRTGDRVRYRSDGRLEFLGRIDQQVKLRGYRIEPGEIESVCMRHTALREAVVIMQHRSGRESRLVAYLTTLPGQTLEAHELRNFLKQQLPAFMVPAVFVFLQTLPLTPNGKVDRKRLPAPEAEQMISRADYIAPRDLFELEMTKLWEELLHVQPVGIYDDFFALGGSSLTALQLMGAVQVRFGARLPLAEFLQKPIIAQLCAMLRVEATLSVHCLVPLQQGSSLRPLFIVHPQGGGALCYLPLAKALGKDEVVYGLQAPGYDSDEPFLNNLEEMACRYIAELRQVTPAGPYRLAGWSMGGIIAFEMARQLEAQGECVDFLGLIDARSPGKEGEIRTNEQSSVRQIQLNLAVNYFGLEESALTGFDEEEIFALLLRRAKTLDLLPPDAGVEFMRHQVKVMLANQLILEKYRDQAHPRIQANISLFCAAENDEKPSVKPQQWQQYTAGKVSVFAVPGNHHNLVNPPYVLDLADSISAVLQHGSSPARDLLLIGEERNTL